ncbi:MAG: DUF4112 domain-containing protein [Muribaculaceae bacterium]|nr:DUF4112 domain-containing protein [Muribaculaceae bacterium]
MGKVVELVDRNSYDRNVASVDRHLQDEAYMMEKLSRSTAYKYVWIAKKYDDWFLDPIVGFFLPAFGDILSSAAILPAFYIALTKIRSIKLAFAILIIGAIDMLVGAIPTVGDIVDAFYKANKKAARWIVGYVEKDPYVKEEVNQTVIWGSVGLVILIGLIYLCFSMIMGLYHWIFG